MAWTVPSRISTKCAAIGVLVLALTCVSHQVFAQQGAPKRDTLDEKRAADAVSEGKAAFAAGDMHGALRAFRDAWEIAQTPQIAANLGTIEANFGLHRDAAEHLRFALSHLSAAATGAQRQAISEALDSEKKNAVTLVIHGTPVGALISIDGKAIGSAPIGDETYVDPGTHVVHVESAKFEGQTRSISAFAGETVDVPFNLARSVPATVTALPASTTAVEPADSARVTVSGKPSVALVAAGGGVALAGLATGIIFLAESNAESTDAKAKRDALPQSSNSCGTGTPLVFECKSLHDSVNAMARDRNIATAGFIVGGAATVGTLIYWLWPRKQAEQKLSALPSLTPGYAGFQARLTW